MMQNSKSKAEKPKININYLRDKHREPVTGIFHFYEVPGGGISFNFREFKGDEIATYTMVDGEQYTIPLGVAKHLNKNGWYPEYGHVQTEGTTNYKGAAVDANRIQQRIVKKVRRYGFQSLQFTDVEDLPTMKQPIVEVQTVMV